jgi:hypothetical protein
MKNPKMFLLFGLNRIASEYDIEDFLAIRYLAALLRGSSFVGTLVMTIYPAFKAKYPPKLSI